MATHMPGINVNGSSSKNHFFTRYAAIVLDAAFDKTLDYGIPDSLLPHVKRGVRVEVPLRGRPCSGYVLETKTEPSFHAVLPISKVLSEQELITDEIFEIALWMAKYYCAPLHAVLKMVIPSSIRKIDKHKQQYYVMRAKTRELLRDYCIDIREKHPAQAEVLEAMLQVTKGILLSELLEQTGGSASPIHTLIKKGYLLMDIVRVDRSPLIDADFIRTLPKQLNEEQKAALEGISVAIERNHFATHLLYGVTGSGKTEVYLQAIEKALAANKGTIMLVPEIALTAQTIERFRSRFEGHIAVLHHRLGQGERYDEWHRIRRGDAKIVIGARSAIFSPVQQLGLIIVDEEHENSYKQTEESPCYHARDIAVMRGKIANAAVVLGSATPSIESFYNAKQNKYTLLELSKRAETTLLPSVKVVDMRHEFDKSNGITSFSEALLSGISQRQNRGEQTILFLNKRGYHSALLCKACQHVVKCPHCDVSLTFHKGENVLACHLCHYESYPPSKQCPQCRSPDTMKFRGVGTEHVERALNTILPDVRTLRIDADTTRHKGSHEKLFRSFRTGKADVLIGTQMVAKGLHFPEVTLVGILNCDASLNIPDFRASETVFQLIMQVSGRAGRAALPGEVIIQTCMPDNNTILKASQSHYQEFFHEELESRKMFHYPPFMRMAKIRFSGQKEKQTLSIAEKFRGELLQRVAGWFELHPVLPAGHAKVKDHYQFQFLARGVQMMRFSQETATMKSIFPLPSGIKLLVDIDPISTFF